MKTATLLALLLWLASALSACGGGGDAAPARSVELYGDSTQVGAYPLLRERLGPMVVSRAVGGMDTTSLLAGDDGLNAPWPASVKADIVVINYGIVDAYPRAPTPLETYRENLRRLAQAPALVIFETPNPTVTVEGSPIVARDVAPYAQVMREVAAELGVPLVDVNACFQRAPNWPSLLPDGVHPTAEGYAWIVDQCVVPVLRKFL